MFSQRSLLAIYWAEIRTSRSRALRLRPQYALEIGLPLQFEDFQSINMPQSLRLLRSIQGLSVRNRPSSVQPSQCIHATSRRHITADEKPLPQTDGQGPGPNENQLPHVSEEAAAIGKITGEGGPDIDEHGTSIQEVSSTSPQKACHLHIAIGPQARRGEQGQSPRGLEREYRNQSTEWYQILLHVRKAKGRGRDDGIHGLGHCIARPYIWPAFFANP